MKRIIISILIVIIIAGFFASCNSNPPGNLSSTQNESSGNEGGGSTSGRKTSDASTDGTEGESEGREAQYYPSPVKGYKSAYNDLFGFWFDLPEGWKAMDRSQNGDGYFIVSDASDMDIRVFGLMKDTDEEEYYKKLSGKDGTIEDITFNDGGPGKKITNTDSRVYYLRTDVDTYICFYVNFKSNPSWYEANADKLQNAAMSLRTRMEGPKLNTGPNKINIEDLKLGDISIDMPYENVKKLMKVKLDGETTDDLGGIILFYGDGTEIYLVDNTVYTMNVISGSYQTPRGLKVGDDREKVRELYGEPDNTSGDDNRWGYSYDGYELFTIVFEDDRVTQLQIDMVM